MLFKKHLILALTVTLISSCISEFDNKHASSSRMGVSFIESSCRKHTTDYSQNFLSIKNTYEIFTRSYPLEAATYLPEIYTAKKPMIISDTSMLKRYEEFNTKFPTSYVDKSEVREAIDKISQLYFEALRFETQKCSFQSLAKIENKDVRIMTEAHSFCAKNTGDVNCSTDQVVADRLIQSQSNELKEVYLNLCSTKHKRKQSCLESYAMSLKRASTINNINAWIRDAEHTHESFFKLTDGATKFSCKKDPYENVAIMYIDVYSAEINQYELREMLDFSQKKWSKDDFSIVFRIVNEKQTNTVEIKLTDKMVSYVPHANTNLIYLSKHQAYEQTLLILAHELGHVLGFPDCYMEFYSKNQKELVYYELDHEDNLMCAVDSQNTIPKSYLEELYEKSCLW